MPSELSSTQFASRHGVAGVISGPNSAVLDAAQCTTVSRPRVPGRIDLSGLLPVGQIRQSLVQEHSNSCGRRASIHSTVDPSAGNDMAARPYQRAHHRESDSDDPDDDGHGPHHRIRRSQRASQQSLRLHAFLWVAAAALVAYGTDFVRVIRTDARVQWCRKWAFPRMGGGLER